MLNQPAKGTQDWDVANNQNFQTLDDKMQYKATCVYDAGGNVFQLELENIPTEFQDQIPLALPRLFTVVVDFPENYIEGAIIRLGEADFIPVYAAFKQGDTQSISFNQSSNLVFFSSGAGGGGGGMSPEIMVTAPMGATVFASDGVTNLTAENTTGAVVFQIPNFGIWEVWAEQGGDTTATQTITVDMVKQYQATLSFFTASITVTVDNGSAVTATDGATTLTATSTGTVVFNIPNTGTWTITATLGDQTATGSVNVNAEQNFNITLSYAQVFGVEWNFSNSSTALARLTKANDPNGHVTVDVAIEPAPAVGNGSGSSPFDNYLPWSDMDEFNIINNAVSHRRGNALFSRTANDTVVRIPKYYYKIERDASTSRMRFYISAKPVSGFAVHPAFARNDGGGERDYIYVGKYNSGAGHVSRSGIANLVNITRAQARTGASGKGGPWWNYDYAAWSAIWLLYLVEFADWDSQSRIGQGRTAAGNTAAISTGGCDTMVYHTGRAAGTNGQTAVMYRWIENLWGNVWEWCDGINFNGRAAFICLNPALFADDTATNYTAAGVTLPESGFIRGLGVSAAFQFAFLPSQIGGSETTFIADNVWTNTGWRVLRLGGRWNNAGPAGLFAFDASNAASHASASLGSRLLFLP